MRRVLTFLLVVALVVTAFGALNHSASFRVHYLAGTTAATSLFWVALVLAVVVFMAGVAAVWMAVAGAAATARKLERELQGTYERLRAAEAQVREAEKAAAAPTAAGELPAPAEPAAAELPAADVPPAEPADQSAPATGADTTPPAG